MIWVVYSPPKSAAFGHGSRARDPRRAWKALERFLAEHTHAELHPPLKVTVFGPSQWTDHAIATATRNEGVERFGPVTSISGDFYNWELPAAHLSEALEFAFADEDRPKQQLGPVMLHLWYSFSWTGMPASPPAEHDGHVGRGNRLGVSIGGRRVHIQPSFSFAASDQDSHFIANLRVLEAAMPFVPNDRYYYRVEPKKSGKGKKLVKLQKGWKGAA
jgi:hypothetical protein